MVHKRYSIFIIVLIISLKYMNCTLATLLLNPNENLFFGAVRSTMRLITASCDVIDKISSNNKNGNQVDLNEINMLHFFSNEFHAYPIRNATKLIQQTTVFDSNASTVIFIHGYNNIPNSSFVQLIASNYQGRKNVNFFSYGIELYVKDNYFRSVKYVPYLGKILSNFILELNDIGVNNDKIHLIGFSLGSHIASFTGKHLLRKSKVLISRITGLDPPSPCYSIDRFNALNENDASYVDVIHTSLISFSDYRIGHADFYINGKIVNQPGCNPIDILCSHGRSFEIYAESILNLKAFLAKPCEKNVCYDDRVVIAGYASDRNSRGIYYVQTNSYAPFSPNIL